MELGDRVEAVKCESKAQLLVYQQSVDDISDVLLRHCKPRFLLVVPRGNDRASSETQRLASNGGESRADARVHEQTCATVNSGRANWFLESPCRRLMAVT